MPASRQHSAHALRVPGALVVPYPQSPGPWPPEPASRTASNGSPTSVQPVPTSTGSTLVPPRQPNLQHPFNESQKIDWPWLPYHGRMQHTRLGRTGLKVSRLCLGTMTFGFQCDRATSFAILDRAADGGITFIDTADVYPIGGNLETVGRTEEIIGEWMKGRRQDFVVATKCWGRMGRQRWSSGNSRKHILDAIDDSLRRLQTDYVDLYQLHAPDPETPIDETLRALEDVVRSGRARYVG
jgi:hypothetical protein